MILEMFLQMLCFHYYSIKKFCYGNKNTRVVPMKPGKRVVQERNAFIKIPLKQVCSVVHSVSIEPAHTSVAKLPSKTQLIM